MAEPEKLETKPTESAEPDVEMFGEMSPELEKQLEQYIGEAVKNLAGQEAKDLAIISGELDDYERKAMTSMYYKSLIYKDPIAKRNRQYLHDYMLRTVAKDRKREKAIVEVLRSIQEFKKVTFGQKINQALKG